MIDLAESKVESGRRLLSELDQMGPKPDAALWILFTEIGEWKLGILLATAKSPKESYRNIQLVLREKKIDLDLDEVLVLRSDAPVISLAGSLISTGEEISSIPMSGNVVDGQPLPDLYVYRMHRRLRGTVTWKQLEDYLKKHDYGIFHSGGDKVIYKGPEKHRIGHRYSTEKTDAISPGHLSALKRKFGITPQDILGSKAPS